MEFHPRLDPANLLIPNDKIILGTFPTWSLTYSDDPLVQEEKRIQRGLVGDIDFFYGSSRNRFWIWYQKFVDPNIKTNVVSDIKSSLSSNSIGITDVILQCQRKGRSALDNDLSKRLYNHNFIRPPFDNRRIKILCTSKGLMNQMLLNRAFFNKHPTLRENKDQSEIFQREVLNLITGNIHSVKHSFYRVIDCESGGRVECFSIPSPGSPYRKLVDFGFDRGDKEMYLESYLRCVFEWFTK